MLPVRSTDKTCIASFQELYIPWCGPLIVFQLLWLQQSPTSSSSWHLHLVWNIQQTRMFSLELCRYLNWPWSFKAIIYNWPLSISKTTVTVTLNVFYYLVLCGSWWFVGWNQDFPQVFSGTLWLDKEVHFLTLNFAHVSIFNWRCALWMLNIQLLQHSFWTLYPVSLLLYSF